jgi:hypothetical protein
VDITNPQDGPSVGLPLGFGVIQLMLLAQTKSNQAAVADMIVAYTSASGLLPGLWLRHLQALLRPDEQGRVAFILAHSDGRAWTSHFYRCDHNRKRSDGLCINILRKGFGGRQATGRNIWDNSEDF